MEKNEAERIVGELGKENKEMRNETGMYYKSKFKILRIKKREYRDGIKSRETRLGLSQFLPLLFYSEIPINIPHYATFLPYYSLKILIYNLYKHNDLYN